MDELAAAESASGLAMPDTLRRLFLLAGSVDVSWHLADDIDPPKPFHQIFSGGSSWSVDRVVTVIEDYRGWVTSVFPDPNDPYDAIWHDKYPWLEVPNGDVVAIGADGRVVYLSHDDGEGHGFVLGQDVFDFLEHWTRLGCPGPEDWQWLPFAVAGGDGLDPDGGAGRSWRAWFGIP